MPETPNQQIVARQVERIVRQLTSLSTLPGVAADLLAQFKDGEPILSVISDKIESDPALTARVLLLARQQGVRFAGPPSVAEAVTQLPVELLREAVISVSVFETFQVHEDSDAKRQLPRKQLALHSLAVASCAERLAERVLEPDQRHPAYLAGLLHDIGKYALEEVMPKSFDRMIQEAASERLSLCAIEQRHLGLDHTVLGKRLGQKWGLPEPVVSAIWLHHCDVASLREMLPQAQLACVTALANQLVRKAEVGHSGSFDAVADVAAMGALLGLDADALDEVSHDMAAAVREKSVLLGLEGAGDSTRYYSMIRQTAVDLAENNRRLSESGQSGQASGRQAKLIADFLDAVDDTSSPLELAQAFAAGWQQCFETGLCCVYAIGDSTEPYVELAAIDRQQHEIIQTLTLPDMIPPVPEVLRTKTAVLPTSDAAKWLQEQLEIDFDPSRMKMAPLRMGDEVVAVLMFEQDTDKPASDEGLLCCKVAASAIAMAQAVRKNLELAEKFVQMMASLRQVRAELARQESLAGLAEMAAGAAHELNNPLSIISGRSQLLLASEDDEDKKQILQQMQERTVEISQIVEDLMTFARPADPKKQTVSVSELVAHAVKQAREANGLEQIEASVSVEGTGSVFVDALQVSRSLSHIICNALQSYKGDNGPVTIACAVDDDAGKVTIAISDQGCGMDSMTLAKATEPFFSYRPAGRRRGMGLAHAQRLLQLNGGELKLISEPDKGTTVTVTLPKA